MQFPQRFATGVRNRTIVNPAWLHANHTSNEFGPLRVGPALTFQGLCSDYDFGLQRRNYERLQAVLKRNGTDFLYVAGVRYRGDVQNHRFVACAANGSLLWNKYVGFVAQGGQNHVYVAGRRIKVSVFLGLTQVEQDALRSHSLSRIKSVFGEKRLAYLDEANDLWN